MSGYTEKQIVAILKNLEVNWPDSHWLYAAGGTLHLMRNKKDGKRSILPDCGMNPKMSVESFDGIECDGGDW